MSFAVSSCMGPPYSPGTRKSQYKHGWVLRNFVCAAKTPKSSGGHALNTKPTAAYLHQDCHPEIRWLAIRIAENCAFSILTMDFANFSKPHFGYKQGNSGVRSSPYNVRPLCLATRTVPTACLVEVATRNLDDAHVPNIQCLSRGGVYATIVLKETHMQQQAMQPGGG